MDIPMCCKIGLAGMTPSMSKIISPSARWRFELRGGPIILLADFSILKNERKQHKSHRLANKMVYYFDNGIIKKETLQQRWYKLDWYFTTSFDMFVQKIAISLIEVII